MSRNFCNSMILDFKVLFLGITDGWSQMLLDFSLVGEEGKKNYGLKQKQLEEGSPRSTPMSPTPPNA